MNLDDALLQNAAEQQQLINRTQLAAKFGRARDKRLEPRTSDELVYKSV